MRQGSLTHMRHSLPTSTWWMTGWWSTAKQIIPTVGLPDPQPPPPQKGPGPSAGTSSTHLSTSGHLSGECSRSPGPGVNTGREGA